MINRRGTRTGTRPPAACTTSPRPLGSRWPGRTLICSDRGADLLHREGCRDGHAELACRDQARNLLDGAGGGVSAVCRRDPVDLCGDGGDALVRHAKFSCRPRRVRPVQVDRRGDAAGSQGTDPAGQAVPIGGRLGPAGTQGIGRRRRSRPDHSRAREPGELHGEHADPASRAADEQRVARAGIDDGEGGGGRAPCYSKGGGGAVVDAVGGMVRVAAAAMAPAASMTT